MVKRRHGGRRKETTEGEKEGGLHREDRDGGTKNVRNTRSLDNRDGRRHGGDREGKLGGCPLSSPIAREFYVHRGKFAAEALGIAMVAGIGEAIRDL